MPTTMRGDVAPLGDTERAIVARRRAGRGGIRREAPRSIVRHESSKGRRRRAPPPPQPDRGAET